jgi:tetratricopeptide (TPR) repeat protein
MMRPSLRCLLFGALVCNWVVLAHSQSKKLWQVYAEAGETAFNEFLGAARDKGYIDVGRRSTAEAILLSAIKEAESEGVEDRWLGKINYELGLLYSSYESGKAEGYFLAALRIFEKLKESSNAAIVVINLSSTYCEQDKYSEAEKSVREGLEFVEQSKKADDEAVASLVEIMVMIHLVQNRIEDAEATFLRLQSIGEAGKVYAERLEQTRRRAVDLYEAKRYPEAERLLKGELALLKKQSALTTLAAFNAFNTLADVRYRQRGQSNFKEAETEKKQSIEIVKNLIAKKALDPDTNPMDWAQADLALIQYAQGNGAQAEPLFQQSLASMKQRLEQKSGDDRKSLAVQIADRLEQLAKLHCDGDRNEQAARLYKEALEIREKDIGQDDPGTIATTKAYVGVLRNLKRDAEAQELEARLKRVSE